MTYKNMSKESLKEFSWYIVFGALTTLVAIGSFYVFARCLNMNYILSNILSWFLAVAFAYITNKIWVFKDKATNKKDLIREITTFLSGRVISLVVEIVGMFLLIDYIGIAIMIAKGFISIIVALLNYIFSKLVVFKK